MNDSIMFQKSLSSHLMFTWFMVDKYATIKIPKTLAEEIERFIEERDEFGYVSKSDFTKHALRELLLRLYEK
jgi:Arc/MetJ-type ribon-helix-helix transcriptional regulator